MKRNLIQYPNISNGTWIVKDTRDGKIVDVHKGTPLPDIKKGGKNGK